MKRMNRKWWGLLLSAALLASCSTGPEGPRTADGKPVGEQIMGVYRLYPERVAPLPEAPEGYEAFYISHYGRHGSRYLLADSQYLWVHDLLSRADADGRLTSLGRRIHADLNRMLPQFEGRAGDLTPIGIAQQEAIARRMTRRNNSVFGPDAVVEVSTSATPRTHESMEAFCGELRRCCPNLRIECREDVELNPYSSASGIPNADDLRVKSLDAAWRPDFDAYCRRRLDSESFAGHLFSDPAYAAVLGDPVVLERSLFNLAIHFAGCGIPTDWFDLFTSGELTALAECEAYTFYMEKGPARETSDRTWALSAHILDRMLADATEAFDEGIAAHLRFGHDGCIMALLTLMGAEGWDSVATTPDETARAWDISRIPMASNLQWIFYRPVSGDGAILVRLLLNEEPLQLSITDPEGLVCWDNLHRDLTERCRNAFSILEKS